jgi:recombination protein RecR
VTYPKLLQQLINQFSGLPGIGPKSAERLVLYLLRNNSPELEKFPRVLADAQKSIHPCPICFDFTDRQVCTICSDKKRDTSTICVVSEPQAMHALESTGHHQGLYHILGGTISPTSGITPDKLHIKELLARVKQDSVKEIILAFNPDLEGESTALYLKKELGPLGVKLSKLARGLPMGADLEYADEVTLSAALDGRKNF